MAADKELEEKKNEILMKYFVIVTLLIGVLLTTRILYKGDYHCNMNSQKFLLDM